VKADALQHYHARMQRVLQHIEEHIDEDLSLEVLSGVAAFSRHHFHRQFSNLFGIAPRDYVHLARLKRASYRLAYRDAVPVIEIALDSGYEAPESFSRAFKDRFGQTPTEFRRQPDWAPWHAALAPFHQARSNIMTSYSDDQVSIIDFPATSVALMEHRGNPAALGDTIRRFIAWRKSQGLSPKVSATYNILYSDPETAAPDDYRIDLCVSTDRPIEPNGDGIKAGLIPESRVATLRLLGSTDHLRAAVSWLYGEWLPASAEEPGDFPLFVQRVRFFPDVPENEAVTDIFLPLA